MLPRKLSGLKADSVANASQIVTVDRERLERLAGSLPRSLMRQVDQGLRWFLQLDE